MIKKNHFASFGRNEVGSGVATQTKFFRAIGASASPGKWYTVHRGVWVSAGAAYGPQVEFPTERTRTAFLKAHPGAFKSTACGSHLRVDVDSVTMFVAAFEAAKAAAEVDEEEEVEEEEVPVTAIVNPSLQLSIALAMEEVEEEEEKAAAISPREAAIAEIKAMRPDRDEAYVMRVLARMGL